MKDETPLPVVKVIRVADLKKKVISLATAGEIEHYGKKKPLLSTIKGD